jgi:hypothetical protein
MLGKTNSGDIYTLVKDFLLFRLLSNPFHIQISGCMKLALFGQTIIIQARNKFLVLCGANINYHFNQILHLYTILGMFNWIRIFESHISKPKFNINTPVTYKLGKNFLLLCNIEQKCVLKSFLFPRHMQNVCNF